MCYVDWLAVYQEHAESLPIRASTVILYIDPATGEVTGRAVKGYQHEGSFDTAVRVRCDGRKVEVSGNPSRYGRPDNVFGFLSVLDALEVYNRILRELGLPEFSSDDRPYIAPREFQRSEGFAYDGAILTRVDFAANYSTGSLKDSRLFMRWLGGQMGVVGYQRYTVIMRPCSGAA
jgi:hypothetical protein